MLQVLYMDSDLIVCVKPVGVLSQGQADKNDNMNYLLAQYFESRGESPQSFCVHRLDRAVGGTMVYARTQRAAAKLSALVSSNDIKKEYLAIVCGTPESESGVYKDLLFKDSAKNKSYVVKRMRKGVKEASLEYELLGTVTAEKTLSLVRIRLHTGRTHQIRVQFSSRKMPLLGDGKYGSSDNNCTVSLWSHRLSFRHPFSGKELDLSSLPDNSKYAWSLFEQ
ncbi:MAG: RluA family pseudouridine synthase [Clostridia bacterium]|nr:RluA family pseudouridine synthase [Clostridia bacterium]